MNATDAIPVLNRLLTILSRTLPAYMADAKPWSRADDRRLREAFGRLASDLRTYARRVAEAIVERGGRPEPGRFSATLAAKNDLGLDYLLPEAIEDLRRAASAIQRCSARLEGQPALHSLAEEIYGNVRGHADVLREFAVKAGKTTES